MTLGDLVKKYRAKYNISMEEFSKLCDLSKGYISMLENNTNPRNNKPIAPTLPTIKKIALAMNMDVDSILKLLDSDQKVSVNFDQEYISIAENPLHNNLVLSNLEKDIIYKFRLLTASERSMFLRSIGIDEKRDNVKRA